MERIYLHIGLPKTGTSYIQSWMNLNNALLRANRFWVPTKPIYAHRIAAEYITDERRAARQDVAIIKGVPYQEVDREINEALKHGGYSSGILSSEYFFECAPSDLRQLTRQLAGVQIVIVLFLRRQDRMIESGYNQEVKAMGHKAPLSPPRYLERLNWLKLYERWSDEFGADNIRVVNYDVASKENRLLEEFLTILAVPPDLREAAQKLSQGRNESLPANLLEFKRLANEVNYPELEHWLLELVDAGMPAPPFRLAPDVARQHLAFYQESNAELQRRLNEASEKPLFPEYEAGPSPLGLDYTNQLPMATLVQIFTLHLKQEQDKSHALLQRVDMLEKAVAAMGR